MNTTQVQMMIEDIGLMPAIQKSFGKDAKIKLFFSDSILVTKIEKLNLSVRSYNCLKRAGIDNVDLLINAVNEKKLPQIRNLGEKSIAEIYVRLYEFGYENLSEEGKENFVKSLIEINKKV